MTILCGRFQMWLPVCDAGIDPGGASSENAGKLPELYQRKNFAKIYRDYRVNIKNVVK